MKKYEKYKPSGVEWLGDIPEHWKALSLKRVARLVYGSSLQSEIRENGNIPVYGSNGIVGYHKIAITKSPCIIIGRKGSHGKINFSTSPCFPIDTTYYIDQSTTNHLIEWLAYSLQILNLDDTSQDTGVPGLSREDAYSKILPTPPPIEQQIIADFLDIKCGQIEQVITNRKKQIELLKQERQAIISEAVTRGIDKNVQLKPSGVEWLGDIPEHWEIRRLKFLSRVITGEKDTIDNELDGEYPFFVRSQTIERISTYSFDGEAVLTAGDGVGVGKVFHYYNGKFDFHQRVYKISHFKHVTGKFFFYYFQELASKEFNKWNAKSTVDSLRRPMLTDFPVVLPPICEQLQIVSHIKTLTAKIDSIIQKYERQLDLLKEYKTAIISQVVTGAIDVRNWNKK